MTTTLTRHNATPLCLHWGSRKTPWAAALQVTLLVEVWLLHCYGLTGICHCSTCMTAQCNKSCSCRAHDESKHGWSAVAYTALHCDAADRICPRLPSGLSKSGFGCIHPQLDIKSLPISYGTTIKLTLLHPRPSPTSCACTTQLTA